MNSNPMRRTTPTTLLLICLAALSGGALHSNEVEQAEANPLKRDKSGARKLGWSIGVQAWTFGAYSLPEQLELIKSLDADFVELGPNVKLVPGEKKGKSIYTLTDDEKARLKKLLDDSGLPFTQLYVHAPKGEEKWREAFEFARVWGVDTLVGEPFYEDFPVVDKLCKEYKTIRIAIHNHPKKENRYWDPDVTLKQIEPVSDLIGFGPDLGHWLRMGVEPVEQFKRDEVAGRLLSMHLNDVLKAEDRSPHVVLGTGAGQTGAMLTLLKEQGYQGRFVIEHGNWRKNYGEVAASITFFDRVAGKLAESR